MSNELVERISEAPIIRDDWEYQVSVDVTRPIIGRWKREARDMILPELWNAHTHLDGRGGDRRSVDYESKVKVFTFETYCEAIGITRQTGRNWLLEAGLLTSGAHVSNNTGNQENYTPKIVVDAVRTVLGAIDLDPASCDEAQAVVEASEYFTEEDDGLARPWQGRVFLNPPYQMPQIREFTNKLISELPNLESAILLTNNNTDTKWFRNCAEHAAAICFTSGRIRFYTPTIAETQPTNGQTFFYFGDDVELFVRIFSQNGIIMKVLNET